MPSLPPLPSYSSPSLPLRAWWPGRGAAARAAKVTAQSATAAAATRRAPLAATAQGGHDNDEDSDDDDDDNDEDSDDDDEDNGDGKDDDDDDVNNDNFQVGGRLFKWGGRRTLCCSLLVFRRSRKQHGPQGYFSLFLSPLSWLLSSLFLHIIVVSFLSKPKAAWASRFIHLLLSPLLLLLLSSPLSWLAWDSSRFRCHRCHRCLVSGRRGGDGDGGRPGRLDKGAQGGKRRGGLCAHCLPPVVDVEVPGYLSSRVPRYLSIRVSMYLDRRLRHIFCRPPRKPWFNCSSWCCQENKCSLLFSVWISWNSS